ncbi:MAG: HEAT repeat domain-containing protein [Methanomicrobiaceae archaeon]|nr:HEAT repeat domain-containing protein [Methanomicrobiaceae archaeon]
MEGRPEGIRRNIDLLRAGRDVPGLIDALGSEDPVTRQRAALALGDMGGEQAIAPLIHALGDPVASVRESAADSLALLGEPAVSPLIEILTDPERAGEYHGPGETRPARSAGGEIVGGDLSREARSGFRRMYAAAILGEIGDARAIDPLISALYDDVADVRCQAGGALGKMGGRAVDPLSRAMSGSSDRNVRIVAAGILGDTRDPAAVRPLIEALGDEDDDIRGAAAGALVQIGAPAVDPLLAALESGSKWVRLYAAGALGFIGDPRAIDPLRQRASSDEDADIRSVAEDAIEKIRRRGAVEEAVPPRP